MDPTDFISAVDWQGVDCLLMGYAEIIVDGSYVPVLPAHLSAVTIEVFSGTEQVDDDIDLVIADSIHDPIKTGNVWTRKVKTHPGYNFSHLLDGETYLPDVGQYKVKVTFTLTGGSPFYGMYLITTKQVEEAA